MLLPGLRRLLPCQQPLARAREHTHSNACATAKTRSPAGQAGAAGEPERPLRRAQQDHHQQPELERGGGGGRATARFSWLAPQPAARANAARHASSVRLAAARPAPGRPTLARSPSTIVSRTSVLAAWRACQRARRRACRRGGVALCSGRGGSRGGCERRGRRCGRSGPGRPAAWVPCGPQRGGCGGRAAGSRGGGE